MGTKLQMKTSMVGTGINYLVDDIVLIHDHDTAMRWVERGVAVVVRPTPPYLPEKPAKHVYDPQNAPPADESDEGESNENERRGESPENQTGAGVTSQAGDSTPSTTTVPPKQPKSATPTADKGGKKKGGK